MTNPTNFLQQVQTYNKSDLAMLLNFSPFISTSNTKFQNFQNITGNLGNSVTFDTPPQYTTVRSLVADYQESVQNVQTLTVDQPYSCSYSFPAQEQVFNLQEANLDYIKVFGKAAVAELGATIEEDAARVCNSSLPVRGARGVPTGALHTESGPWRYYGNGINPIDSYQKLAQAQKNFTNVGMPRDNIKVYLPDVVVPSIIGTGLNQFAPRRNDEIAQSWEIGEFGTPAVKYYESNLLPIQMAGTIGNSSLALTVVSTNDPTGANITQITATTTALSDPNVLKVGDLLTFQDNISGKTNLRQLTYYGHHQSYQQVQIRVTQVLGGGSDGAGSVTFNITPALQSLAGGTQNINTNVIAGMQLKGPGDHVCGLIVGGNALFLGMPRLPTQIPFPTSSEYDSETGVGLRLTYGSIFGGDQQGFIHDAIMGYQGVGRYLMRLVFPLTQTQ